MAVRDLPGRVLMIVFAVGCLVLAYLTGARTGRSRLAGVSAVVLIVGYPVTLTYFATATPYAMVSCLSLALVFVLLVVRSRVLAYGARQASFSGHLCHPARHVADRHDPNRLGAADRAVAKDRVPCGRLSDLHGRVRCHGVGIRTWIAPGCSGYPGTCAVNSGRRHTTTYRSPAFCLLPSRRSILCYPLAIFQPISTVIFFDPIRLSRPSRWP